jgi:predicted fused transcriptional regulator/phosphomethylpyrimidine kinase/predicted transcriptional regulator
MQPPDELMTQTFLPAMRQLVALRLRGQGLSQSRIASVLGITQASVSLYLSSERERAYSSLSQLSVSSVKADTYATILALDAQKGAVEGVRTLTAIWTQLLGSGSVCAAHRKQYPGLADCQVCIGEYGGRGGTRLETIAEVAEAVKLLEASPVFVNVMPEVSVNIASVSGDGSTPEEVVAIPGRIVRVKDRARAMFPPEAGASTHLSKILLMVRGHRPEVRSCLNLRFDRRIERALKKLKLEALEIGSYSHVSADPTADALRRRLEHTSKEFDVVIDPGASGIEPNVYLFGRSPGDVVGLALKIAETYSAN